MGLEANCVRVRGRTRVAGKALLETDHLLFRGATARDMVREKVLFSAISDARVDDHALVVTHAGGTMRLHFDDGVAAKWLAKLRSPRSLLDKLGVKEGMRVAVIAVDDAAFAAQLAERVPAVDRAPRAGTDLIFLGAESPSDLARLARLRDQLKPNGAIWVVHRKGKNATLKDTDVFAAARAAGLVDNKVASFSATHTAERLVIPLAARR